MSMCNLFLAILVTMLSQVQLYVVLLVVGWGERDLHGWLGFPFSTFCTVSRHCLQLLPVPGGWDFVCSRHIPSNSAGSVGRQALAGNLEDLAVTPHILSLRRRGLAVRIRTVRYARLCGLYLQKIERVFRSLFPLSLSLRMSNPFDRAPHLSYDLHPREISALACLV